MKNNILVINPGSTSTKIAVYSTETNDGILETIRHNSNELEHYDQLIDQLQYRKQMIEGFLASNNIEGSSLQAVVGRGGFLRPIEAGTYEVNEKMLDDLRNERFGTHASNLGALLSNEFAKEQNVKAFIVDPVVVDELDDIARLSGLKGIERRSIGHPLNQKMVARKVTKSKNMKYEESRLIVVHLGGGISVGAHKNGRIVDMANGLDGEGSYSPERSGSLPLINFAEKIINEKLEITEIKKLVAGKGGLYSYLQDKDIVAIEERINNDDQEAKLYLDGMCYQVAKSIGEQATVLKGQVDFIILTGGISYSEYVTGKITEATDWIADIKIVPGEMEMEGLFEGAKRVLDDVESAKIY